MRRRRHAEQAAAPCGPAGMSDSIGSRIRSGLAWKAGSQIMLQISRMVVALVLARLLAPHDWGLAAMVLVVLGLRRRLHRQRARNGADPAARLLPRRTARPSSGERGNRARCSRSAGIALSRAARRLLRRARDPPALRGPLGRLLRERARNDTVGAARTRDALPPSRAPADRGNDRRRGDGNRGRPGRLRCLGDRRSAAGRGRRSRPCCCGTSRRGGRR